MAHFGLSMLILVAAATLAWRARARGRGERRRPRCAGRLGGARRCFPLATLVVFAGTAATAAGPHSGGASRPADQAADVRRAGTRSTGRFTPTAPIAFAFGIAAVLVWVVLERRQAAAQVRRALSWLCVLIALQGVIGAVQFEAHLPTELVWVHVVAGVAVLALRALGDRGDRAPRAARGAQTRPNSGVDCRSETPEHPG